MDPVTLALMGASLGGGIIAATGGKKMIDPNWLKQHFGADQVNEEMISLFNNIINSPYGQQLMTDAASQGSQFEAALRSGSAQTGLSAGEGGSSGASIFSDAAAGGATKNLQNQAKAGIFQQTLPVAANMVNARLAAYMGQPALGAPSGQQLFGQALGSAGMAGLSATDWGKGKTSSSLPTKSLTAAANQPWEMPAPRATVQPDRAQLMQTALNNNAVQPSRFRASLGGSA